MTTNQQDQGVGASASPTVATHEPSPVPGLSPSGECQLAGFILKAWDVTVVGYGTERINAASRGAALAKAWRSDAFSGITFSGFLKIASAWRAMFVTEGFGASITVDGKPAFFVDRNRAYVQIAYPGGKHVFSAHPYDVLPESFRPEAYRTPPVDRSRNGGDASAAPFTRAAVPERQAPNPYISGTPL